MDRIKATASIAADEVRSIEWSSVKRNTVLVAWMVSGLVAFLAPIIQWTVHKKSFYRSQGYMIEYENQQREYEEQQNQNQNGEYQYGNESEYGYLYKECSWWNVACQRQQMRYAEYYMGGEQDQNEANNYNEQIPSWFVFLSGGQSEELNQWKEENTGVRQEMDETSPTAGEIMAVIYMFLVLFVVLIIGCGTFYKSRPFSTLKWGLAFLINMIVVNFLLLPSIISNEDRMWDESIYGFYGQIGVLMAYFDFWVLIFSTVFLIVLHREEKKSDQEPVKIQEEDYKTMSA
ncbi:unnamed protein product [Cylindrotheca closterium]|uniref:Uncharacterized protein n=1 Tax=Cylindrotheca closterium TaxID=2856 RepID=A0AAD2FXP8_9STRA|nr:unnamed protein product [Cylindrotheca closterium]